MEQISCDVERVASKLLSYGIDICHPLSLTWYNNIAYDIGAGITSNNDNETSPLCFILGCTRRLWPALLYQLAKNSEFLKSSDPIDNYFNSTAEQVLKDILGERYKYRTFSAHSRYTLSGASPFIAIQKAAHVAGLAYLDTDVHLAVHPVYGQWFNMRAMVVIDSVQYSSVTRMVIAGRPDIVFPDDQPAPPTPEYVSNQPIRDMLKQKLKEALNSKVFKGQGVDSESDTSPAWERWVGLREAVIPRHHWRYSTDQILYHYTRNLAHLKRCVEDFEGHLNRVVQGGMGEWVEELVSGKAYDMESGDGLIKGEVKKVDEATAALQIA